MARKKMVQKTSSETPPVSTLRKMNSASTLPATLEACSGNSGSSLTIMVSCSFITQHDEDEAREREHGGDAAGANDVHRRLAVLAGSRVVVETEQEQRVADGADLALRRPD